MTKDSRDPNRWPNREIEADSEGYLAAQAAHAEDREERERQRWGADDLARFTQRFVEAGGKSSERGHTRVPGAHTDLVAEAASSADAETLRDACSRLRHSL